MSAEADSGRGVAVFFGFAFSCAIFGIYYTCCRRKKDSGYRHVDEGEELDEAIAKFENLDEETFNFVVAAMTKRKGAMKKEEKAEKKDDKENPFAKKDKKEDEEKEAPAAMNKRRAEVEPLEEEVDEAEAEAQAEGLEEAVEDEDIAMAEAIDDEDSSEELRSTASEWFGSLLKSTANLK